MKNNGSIKISEKCSFPAIYKLFNVFLLEINKKKQTNKQTILLVNA